LRGRSDRAALELAAAAAAEVLTLPGGVVQQPDSFRALGAGVAR
jgi:hypothetical protein